MNSSSIEEVATQSAKYKIRGGRGTFNIDKVVKKMVNLTDSSNFSIPSLLRIKYVLFVTLL